MGHGSDARGTCGVRRAPHSDRGGKARGFEEERTQLQLRSLGSSVSRNEVKHGIPSVAAMMIGYVWIIGRCLPNA